MIQKRIEETLGLTRAGAGGHQGGRCLVIAGQTLPRRFLMDVAGVFGLESLEEVLPFATHPERQAELHVWPLHPAALVPGEALHDSGKQRIRGLEADGEELLEAGLDFAG